MARPRAKAPDRTYHISGQSIVKLDGRDFYLGKHDSPESISRYAILIGVYQAGGLKLPADFNLSSIESQVAFLLGSIAAPSQRSNQPITVRHVAALFREFIKDRYANEPKVAARQNQICDELDRHVGDMQAMSLDHWHSSNNGSDGSKRVILGPTATG